MTRALLISVGGSPAPVVSSIESRCPEYVVYFTSRDSRRVVREQVEPQLRHSPKDHEIIVTPDEANLVLCVRELMRELPRLLDLWNLSYTELQGDYTGGTKTMSAALVLALLGRGASYSYVGGDLRTKNGLGTVENGHEVLLTLQNPWDVLAVNTLRDLALLFNNHHFRPAADVAADAAEKTEGLRPLFAVLRDMALGYYHWDTFLYKPAKNYLGSAWSSLQRMQAVNAAEALHELGRHLGMNMAALDVLVQESTADAGGQATVRDIMANAIRRADDGHHYDDAVTRLYSAIEKAAKVRLREGHGLDNGNLDLERLEDTALREELREHCTDSRDGRVKLPLHRSFSLLYALGDPLGARYDACATELGNLLNIRNDSLLAHGFKPVREDTFTRMLELALGFLDVRREDLPLFPILDGERLGMVVW